MRGVMVALAVFVVLAGWGGQERVRHTAPPVGGDAPEVEALPPATESPPPGLDAPAEPTPELVQPEAPAPAPVPGSVPGSAPPPDVRPPDAPPQVVPPPAGPVEVAYRVEVRSDDPALAGFPALVEAALSDPRGWSRAGFVLVRRDDAAHLVVLAEGAEVDALCLPYDTYGQYSCQNGPVVAINADRWRHATPQWTGDLHSYRLMLVNHEVGHLLGQRHTDCARAGEPAAVMVQQSTELRGCLPNPWPLPWEIDVAARHDQPIAPGYGE